MQLAIHVVQSRLGGVQKKHWDKTNKENYCLKLVITKGYEERATRIKVTCDQAIFFFGGGGGGHYAYFFSPAKKKRKEKKSLIAGQKKKKKQSPDRRLRSKVKTLLLHHCASVRCVIFTRGVVKTRLIRLRVIEGPNARDQIALCGFHSFLVEVQTNAGGMHATHA